MNQNHMKNLNVCLLSASQFFVNRNYLKGLGALFLKASQLFINRHHRGIIRVALLIGHPGSVKEGSEGYLAGIFRDIDAYREFLKSPLGGAWQDYEIFTLQSPPKYLLNMFLKLASTADYTFIVFIANEVHEPATHATMLKINEKQTMLERELVIPGARQTIILDYRRKTLPVQIGDESVLTENAQLSMLDHANSRKGFDKTIMKCDPEVIITRSCQSDQYACDTRSYSSQLMRQSKNFALHLKYETYGYDSLSIAQVHVRAASVVRTQSNRQQIPLLERTNVKDTFPFCILAWEFSDT